MIDDVQYGDFYTDNIGRRALGLQPACKWPESPDAREGLTKRLRSGRKPSFPCV